MKKRALAILLTAVMAAGLTACSGGAAQTTAAPAATTAAAATEAPKAEETKAEEKKEEAPAAGGFYAGKTVEVVVPWGAGGGADTACRLVCQYIEKELGCTCVINNVTGGGGSIGLNQMLSAANDGLTVAYVANTDTNGNIMLDGVTYGIENFAPIARFAADPHVIVASNASGIKTLEDLIAAGQDGTTLWGIGGAWTHWDFLKIDFEKATGAKFKRLVYDGGAAAMTDIMNGDCTVATPFVSEALSAIDAGEAVGIAITSKERNSQLPDIPTVAELGYDGFESTMWRGFAAQAGAPEDALKEFADAVGRACGNPELIDAATKAGVTIDFMGYDDFQTFFKENHEAVKEAYEANKDM